MNNHHKNARTTPHIRALIADRALRKQQLMRDIASTFGISKHTVYKWLSRYQEAGLADLESASSRPHSSPRQMPEQWVELIRKMRLTLKWTAKQVAQALSLAYSTVKAVLRRLKLNRASHLEPVQPVQRYEYPRPGDMLHMDIKKLPRFDRSDHRVTNNRRQNTRGAGYECVHICIDDHRRWAFARALTDWINHYNKQRPHGSIGNLPPVSRIPKLREQRV